jgi:glycosyltransferase involved in cell wall biosynthesis
MVRMKYANEKISVIIPVYNEAENILSNIKEIDKTLDGFGCKYEIIAIDDGSEDDSFQILKGLESQIPHFTVRKNAQNFGKGRALKKAFKYTSGDLIVWLDADMDIHPYQIRTLYDIMQLDGADIVIGSKMHPNSAVDYPLHRKVVSFLGYCLSYMLFGLPCHDTQTGLKLFKREVLVKVLPRILVKQFAFDLEVLVNAHHLGFTMSEAPIVLKSQRRFGRIGIGAIKAAFWDTMAVWYRMYILKYYDNIDHHRRKGLLREFKRVRK